MPIVLALQHRSPFKEAINRKILELREAGLLTKWLKDSSAKPVVGPSGKRRERNLMALSLGELQGIMIVLAGGLGLATLAFSCENLGHLLLSIRFIRLENLIIG